MQVLILRNVKHEGPGLIAELLEEWQIPYDVFDTMGEYDVRAYDAVVMLGGPQSANDPQFDPIIERLRWMIDAAQPFLGICLGMQLLVRAAMGNVIAGTKEIGFRDARGPFIVKPSGYDEIFTDVATPAPIFQLHNDTVELFGGITLVGVDAHLQPQVVRVGRAYGILGHLELSGEMLDNWIGWAPELSGVDAEALRHDYHSVRDAYEAAARQFFTNFFRIAGLVA